MLLCSLSLSLACFLSLPRSSSLCLSRLFLYLSLFLFFFLHCSCLLSASLFLFVSFCHSICPFSPLLLHPFLAGARVDVVFVSVLIRQWQDWKRVSEAQWGALRDLPVWLFNCLASFTPKDNQRCIGERRIWCLVAGPFMNDAFGRVWLVVSCSSESLFIYLPCLFI